VSCADPLAAPRGGSREARTTVAFVLLALLLVGAAASAMEARQWSWLGVRIRDLSEQEMEQIAARHGIREGFGVVSVEGSGEAPSPRAVAAAPTIAGVLKGGAAEKAGLAVGDVILQVDEQPVLTQDAARDALADVGVDRPVRLTVRRGESRLSVTLPSP